MSYVLYKPYREVLQDEKGNIQQGSIAVTLWDGSAVTLYNSLDGAGGAIGSTVATDSKGEFRFFAADGIYRLTISGPAFSTFTKDVVVGSGGVRDGGIIMLADFLNAGLTNGNAALTAAFDVAADRYASGRHDRLVIECEGLVVPMTPGFVITDQGRNVTLRNFSPRAGAGDWIEDDAADIAFFTKYGASMAAAGKTFVHGKPLFTVSGNLSPAFVIENPTIRGIDSAGVRRAAGPRYRGGTSAKKEIQGGYVEDVAGYGIFIGEDSSNKGDVDVTGTRFVPNGNSTAADRNSWGIVLSGNDMHFVSVTSNYSHCPLLVGQYGATTFFTDLDLFNGGVFDPGKPIATNHRLMEYHGNTCTFVGGRWGNGRPHLWSRDIHIIGPKFGVTDGWLSRPDDYFAFHATQVDDSITGFRLDVGEMPFAMRNGDIGLIELVTPTSPNTWRAGVKEALDRLNDYSEITPSRVIEVSAGTSPVVRTFSSVTEDGALIETRAPDTDFGYQLRIGNVGNQIVIRHQDTLRVVIEENGNVKPGADRTQDLGSPANEWDRVYTREPVVDQMAMRSGVAVDPPAGSIALHLNAKDRLMFRTATGLVSAAGLADEHLFRHYQTKAEIEDMRSGTTPTINQTTNLNAVIDELWTRFTSPSTGQNRAGKGGRLNIGSGAILLDRVDVPPGFLFEGDSFSDTILVQASTATTDMVRALARLGKTNKQRAPWALFRNFTIQMTDTVFGPDVGAGPVPLHGLIALPANTDPNFTTGRSYNAYIADHVRSYGASGNGFHCVTTRKRPWHYHCRASSAAGDGFYIGDAADAKIDHCASGTNGGHSIAIIGGDTAKIIGGDFWSSLNAATGKRAVYVERVQEGICAMADVNGAVEYKGQTDSGNPEYGIPIKWKWSNLNFKFRDASFGADDDGNPGVLDGYIITNNARGVTSQGCSFQPAFDRATGVATYRPLKYYHIVGSISSHIANDNLPPLDSPMWAAGPAISGAPVNSWDDLTNLPARLGGVWQVPSTNKDNGMVMTRARFLPGADQGLVGRQDGTAPAETLVGEYLSDSKSSGSAITLTNNTVAALAQITLTPGEWDVTGICMFTAAGATGTALKASLNPSGGAAIISNQAVQYDSRVDPFTTITGDLFRASMGPFRVASATSGTIYLTVRADFTVGAMTAWGRIQARRVA